MRWALGLALEIGGTLAVASGPSAQTIDKQTLSLAAAHKVAAAAEIEARARGVGVVIAIVDAGGHLILLHRLDDTEAIAIAGADAFR